jgi:hypothetical protein
MKLHLVSKTTPPEYNNIQQKLKAGYYTHLRPLVGRPGTEIYEASVKAREHHKALLALEFQEDLCDEYAYPMKHPVAERAYELVCARHTDLKLRVKHFEKIIRMVEYTLES